METEQRNTTTESKTIALDTPTNSAPDISGFLTDNMSRSVPEPEGEFTSELDRPNRERVSTDELFEVVSNRRRRYVLYFLKDTSPEVDLGTLATQVAAWENGKDVSAVSGAERKRAYTSLQQVHLPKMDEVDILEFDKRTGTIRASSSLMGMELDPETPVNDSIPWGWCHFATAVAGVGVVGLSTLNIWPMRLASSPLVTSLLFVPFLVLSVVQILVSE